MNCLKCKNKASTKVTQKDNSTEISEYFCSNHYIEALQTLVNSRKN